MRTVWITALMLAACSKKAEPPKATSGSGSATPSIASGSATGSGSAATVAVGSGSGGAGSGSGSGSAAAEAPILLATIANEQLVIASLDRTGLKKLHEIKVSDSVKFGWLDAKTLVLRDPHGMDDKPTFSKIVDGKPVESAALEELWQDGSLEITATGEVWSARCIKEPEPPDDCSVFSYRRVMPSSTKETKTKPAGIDPDRVGNSGSTMGMQRKSATVAGPAGVTVEKVKLEVATDPPSPLTGVQCTKKGGKPVRHPEVADFNPKYPVYPYIAKQTRWVLADPPVYEVTADQENPVGQIEIEVAYFVACQPRPMVGFISFDGGLWAEYVTPSGTPMDDGSWVFRNGTAELGKLEGGSIRTNQISP